MSAEVAGHCCSCARAEAAADEAFRDRELLLTVASQVATDDGCDAEVRAAAGRVLVRAFESAGLPRLKMSSWPSPGSGS